MSFSFPLKEPLQIRIEEKGWTEPSSIQKQVIPSALEGKDIFAIAPIGSGKTGAFLLPALNMLEPDYGRKHRPKVLILSPTRELCKQIADEARSFLTNQEGIRTSLLTGGVDMNKQVKSFAKGADIVVGTPSRIYDHLRRHTLKVNELELFIIDEADEMMKMGFFEDIQKIASLLKQHQTILISATFSDELAQIAQQFLNDPVKVHVEEEHLLKQNIELLGVSCKENEKLEAVDAILSKTDYLNALIFTNTIKTSDFVAKYLAKHNISCASIHSDMDPKVRRQIMEDYKEHRLNVLCATDVAARGLDIEGVDLVIVYDYPDQKEFLKHRVGRCGRANQSGIAYILLDQKGKKKEIESLLGMKMHIL